MNSADANNASSAAAAAFLHRSAASADIKWMFYNLMKLCRRTPGLVMMELF